MQDSVVQQIKDRLDIVEVIGNYIKLQKAGANYRALCPFHAEKTPSFFVSPARQIWHCFGSCDEGGDIFKFVMKIEGVEFGDALRLLAQKAGIELKPIPPKLKTERQRLYEICEAACRFFEKQLQESRVGQEAKKYLLDRGISEASIQKFRLGYSPDSWQGLSDFLVGRGYTRQETEKAGLCIKNEQGHFYDRFRARIIFPIFDFNAQVIGFGGRIFKSDDLAKYVNSPTTLLYDKSRVLYGLSNAKLEIRKKDFVVLVEGYTDVIMLSQAGYDNVVATSGTALTPYQLRILKRYSENLFTAFDMDIAGDSATKRGIDLAQAEGFNLKVITMPKGLDPADIIAQNPTQWPELVQSAKSILRFYFDSSLSRSDPTTAEGKKEIARVLLPVLKRIPNKIEQASWLQELAKVLGVREDDVRQELEKAKPADLATTRSELVEKPPSRRKTRQELLEERLLTLLFKAPQEYVVISEQDFQFFSPETCRVLAHLQKREGGGDGLNFPAGLIEFTNPISLRAEIEEIGENISSEIRICLQEIKNLVVKARLNEISLSIKKAQDENNPARVQELTEEFKQLAKDLTS